MCVFYHSVSKLFRQKLEMSIDFKRLLKVVNILDFDLSYLVMCYKKEIERVVNINRTDVNKWGKELF